MQALPPRPGQPARPIPERIGEPSVFKHVVYFIKETGRMTRCLGISKRVTEIPTSASSAKRFRPISTRWCASSCCWIILTAPAFSALTATNGLLPHSPPLYGEILRRLSAQLPDGMEDDDIDALAYSPAGFIWDNPLPKENQSRLRRVRHDAQVVERQLRKGRSSSWTITANS